MPFSAPFRETNIAPIFSPGGAVIPWYLLGGVTAAQCVAAYQPKGAADLAASYTNLAHPGTNDAAPGTAPTFATATGWTFNGSSQYLDTGIIPTVPLWSALVQFSGSSTGNFKAIFGTYDSVAPAGQFEVDRFFTGNNMTTISGTDGLSVTNAPVMTSGNYGVCALQPYRNGSAEASSVASSTVGTGNQSIYIGARNANGTASSFAAVNIQAFAVYNITLSSTQIGLISTAMELLSYTPVLSSVTALDSAITISWTGSWAAEGYSVERSLTGQNNWSVLGTTTNTYYTDSTVTTGVTYDYRMQGYNATI